MQGACGFFRSTARFWFVLAFGVGLLAGGTAAGIDLDHQPVAFRINLSLDRVSAFTDTLGRSASVAYPLGSSVNPAGYDFLREPPFDFDTVGTFTTNYVRLGTGSTVTGFATTAAHRLPKAGTISATYVRTDSHGGVSRQGDGYVLGSDELTVGYSRRLREGLAIGGSVKLLHSFLDIEDAFMGSPRETDTDSEGITFNAGVMAALSERWLAGVCGGIGWTNSDADGRLKFPNPPFGPGTVPFSEHDSTRNINVRAGLGYRATDQLGIYADWQYLHLDGGMGSLDIGRMYAGLEATPSPVWTLRLGGSLDTEHEGTVSAGVGFQGIEGVPIQLAYVYNAFPEVNQEFGRNHLLSLSAVLVF